MSSPPTTPTFPTTTEADLAAVAAALRGHDRFLVTTHENPDGDALGSLLATTLALRQLGKDAVMYLGGQAPLPGEYRFMGLDELRRALPDDAAERVLVAVDCANESRLGPDPEILHTAPLVVDIDHHHDNTRFGDVNLVVSDASSSGEVLRDVFRELGVELKPEIAEPLYIALVTDTGRFQYTNTTPKALRLAAELVEAGADVHRVFQGVYESVQFAKLKLLARALGRAQIHEGGRVVVSYLLRNDFAEVGAAEPYSEGIIDYLRAVEGADMAALIREPPRADGPTRRVSLRASVDELDVSAIARKWGGGGHRQAAGFSSERTIAEITEFVVHEFAAAVHARDGGAPDETVAGIA
jgi:phosphoesterase RecJ-like protein